jgi:recombination protein RecT
MKTLDLALRETLTPLAGRAAAMGVDITAIRQAILSMVKDNNRLAQCTTRSICEAVAKALYLGLDLSPAAQEAYLTPRKSRAVLVPDYRGLLKLAYHNPRVGCVESRVVFLRDDFTLDFGDPTGRILRHRPWTRPLEANQENPAIGAYAMLWWKDFSRPLVEWMSKTEIDANAERRGGTEREESAWNTDWPQMARKTVIKRLLNYVVKIDSGERGQDVAQANSALRDEPPPRDEAGYSQLMQAYVTAVDTAEPDGIDAVIKAIREDDRLDHEEKTELFNRATARKREYRQKGLL